MPTVIRELKSVLPQRTLSVDEGEMDRSLADDSLVSYASPASQNVDGNTMLGAVNRIADAVHLLSVRVDSLDRRLVQLETVERRTNELADMNCRLADLSHLQQRVADLEQTLLTTSSDKAVTVNGHSTNVDHVGDTVDVVHSVSSNVDALMKQLNNLTARMTLAENQLMLQSSRRRSLFPEPESISSCLAAMQSTSVTDDVATNPDDRFTPTQHSNKTDGLGNLLNADRNTHQSCDSQDSAVKETSSVSTRSEQLDRIEAMLRGTEEMLQKRSDLSLT